MSSRDPHVSVPSDGYIRYSLSCLAILLLFSVALSAPLASPAQDASSDPALKKVLDLMNTFGRNFRSFTAKITQKKYVAVLKEFDREEKGTFYYERAPNGQARIRRDIKEPTQSVAVIDDGIVIAYEPKLKQARRIDLGKNKDKAEFLAIGIGQSPTSLEKTFNIKLLGNEVVEGRKTYMLELRPKSATASALFASIILWIDAERGLPIQQKFMEPNADYNLVTFSDIKVNTKIPPGTFKLKLPSGVQIIQ